MHTAFSGHQVHELKGARTAMTPADVTQHLASLDVPDMPAHLAARVAGAIASESASRELIAPR